MRHAMRTLAAALACAAVGLTATADAPAPSAAKQQVERPARLCQTRSEFRQFTRAVWQKQRWRRGAPKPATKAAARRMIGCPGGRESDLLGREWRHARSRFEAEAHRCRGGPKVEGRVSYFTGGLTASGHQATEPGIALNIAPGTESGWNNSTTRAWVGRTQKFWVTVMGHTTVLRAIDLGPAGFTQRAIDITEAGVGKLGLPASSITDQWGSAKLVPPGCA